MITLPLVFAAMNYDHRPRIYGGTSRQKRLVQPYEMELYKRIDGRELVNPVLHVPTPVQRKCCTTAEVEQMELAPYLYLRDARGYPVRNVRVNAAAHEQLYRILRAELAGGTVDIDTLNRWKAYSRTFRFVQYDEVLPLNWGKSNTIDLYMREYKPLHWGQRKLLMSEIDLLLRCPRQPYTIVYPGSAHGNHLFVLLDLFPEVTFMLWDPAIYNKRLVQLDRHRRGLEDLPDDLQRYAGRVAINPELSQDDYNRWHRNSNIDAQPWLNYPDQLGFFTRASIEYVQVLQKPLIFISDIRLIEPHIHRMVERAHEITNPYNPYVRELLNAIANRDYHRDMDLQQKWFQEIGAEYGLLKMRMPNPSDTEPGKKHYSYLDGTALLQCWSNIPSGETRLLVRRDCGTRDWDIGTHWQHMGYFHRACRQADYSGIKMGEFKLGDVWPWAPGWDCWMETDIWVRYLGPRATADRVRALSISITEQLLGGTQAIATDNEQSQWSNSMVKQFQKRLDYQSRKYDRTV